MEDFPEDDSEEERPEESALICPCDDPLTVPIGDVLLAPEPPPEPVAEAETFTLTCVSDALAFTKGETP